MVPCDTNTTSLAQGTFPSFAGAAPIWGTTDTTRSYYAKRGQVVIQSTDFHGRSNFNHHIEQQPLTQANHYVLLTNVPKLTRGTHEDRDSLINKTIHWFRNTHHCYSIIRDDIVSAQRFCDNTNGRDSIKVGLTNSELATGLINIEYRSLPPTYVLYKLDHGQQQSPILELKN